MTDSQPHAVPGEILERLTLPAGAPWSARLEAGERLRIVDVEGRQAVDFLCFDAADPANRYNAANTLKFAGNVYLGEGAVLYSDRAEPLMTIVEDSVGHHDTIAGCCSAESNFHRYGKANTPNCRDNFKRALAGHGLDDRYIVANVNFFMNVPVRPDGATAIDDGLSRPGDHVDLRAERAVLVAISNCPQVDNPCNGFHPTPIELIRWRP